MQQEKVKTAQNLERYNIYHWGNCCLVCVNPFFPAEFAVSYLCVLAIGRAGYHESDVHLSSSGEGSFRKSGKASDIA